MAAEEVTQEMYRDELLYSQTDTESAPEDAQTSGVSAQVKGSAVVDIENLHIRLTFDNNIVSVRLYDTLTGRDFLSRLPLTLEFEDYAEAEKISYLSQPLATGKPSETQPFGDFSYYGTLGQSGDLLQRYGSGRKRPCGVGQHRIWQRVFGFHDGEFYPDHSTG